MYGTTFRCSRILNMNHNIRPLNDMYSSLYFLKSILKRPKAFKIQHMKNIDSMCRIKQEMLKKQRPFKVFFEIEGRIYLNNIFVVKLCTLK